MKKKSLSLRIRSRKFQLFSSRISQSHLQLISRNNLSTQSCQTMKKRKLPHLIRIFQMKINQNLLNQLKCIQFLTETSSQTKKLIKKSSLNKNLSSWIKIFLRIQSLLLQLFLVALALTASMSLKIRFSISLCKLKTF